jgi:transcriptional regulator with XRE-family HTH domain
VESAADEPINDMIRRTRIRRGLTQTALAEQLAEASRNAGVKRDQVARWERGGRVPSPYWRQWLAEVLGVPLDQLDWAARRARAVRLLEADVSFQEPERFRALSN